MEPRRLPIPAPVTRLAESAWKRLAALDAFPQPEVVALRYPVVMMHGFGLLSGIRRNGHLHEEAMHLRAHGVLAYAPNVAPYNTVRVRAAMWCERIERILAETGAERLNLIAHSMGGLDARYLISNLGMHAHVATLTTVSTPHHGSSMANIVLERPQRLRILAADLVNWLGASSLEGSTADVLQALAELCPEHVCTIFNEEVPDHPDVRYWSYAGRAGKGTKVGINPVLRVMNYLLYARDGINDGLVGEQSARWGTFMGTIEADHAEQVGLRLFPAGPFNAEAFFLGIAKHLREEGF